MKRCSDEREPAILKELLLPMNMTVMNVAKQKGISDVTLYAWRKQVKAEGMAEPETGKVPDDRVKALLTAHCPAVATVPCPQTGRIPERPRSGKSSR